MFSALILFLKTPKTAKGAPIAAVYANQHRWLECVCVSCRDKVGCVLFVTLRDRLRGVLWIADWSAAAVNWACFVLNDERPLRPTAFA